MEEGYANKRWASEKNGRSHRRGSCGVRIYGRFAAARGVVFDCASKGAPAGFLSRWCWKSLWGRGFAWQK